MTRAGHRRYAVLTRIARPIVGAQMVAALNVGNLGLYARRHSHSRELIPRPKQVLRLRRPRAATIIEVRLGE